LELANILCKKGLTEITVVVTASDAVIYCTFKSMKSLLL